METFGAASGATLGYILNNLPGAYIGYKTGKYFGRRRKNSMAPFKRRRMQQGGAQKRRRTGQKSNYRRPSNNVTTIQYDVTSQYRKKRMPRRKKRQWIKFVKKVGAVNRLESGLKTVVFNNSETSSYAATAQGMIGIHLYGVRGAGDSSSGIGRNDLNRIFSNDPSILQAPPPVVFTPRIGKLVFTSAVLDVTLRNIGDFDSEIDIYYGYHMKNDTGTNLLDAFGGGGATDLPISTGDTPLGILQRGVTPFDLSAALSQSGFHIIRKQKMILVPGKSAFIQHRDPKNHILEWNKLNQAGYAQKKLTYSVMIVHKTTTGTGSVALSNIAYGVTRKYSYQEIAENKDSSALNP